MSTTPSPFDLSASDAWHRWRAAKLENYPRHIAELIVEIGDPRALTPAEHAKLLACVRKTNMVLYASRVGADPDKEIPRAMGRQFGLSHLNHNFLADEDAISSITVNPEGDHPNFIPYTNRPIKWHTDGYYVSGGGQEVRAMVLHCVQPAAEGGENALLDHEIAYLMLRDEDPELVRALMQPDMMTIPARVDEEGVARDTVTGPVFSIGPGGALHMRYTARKRNIVWKDDPASRAAVQRLEELLDSDLPYIYRGTMEAGMGLLCNNVLHDRSGFTDTPGSPKRLLYRARYFDRIRGS